MLRVGLIGAGGIAASHIAGFEALRARARIVAVADIDPRRAMRRAAECGAEQVVTEYGDLLRDPEIDAVDIVTPAATHTPIALEALAAGKHVLCEKPVAGTLAELDRLEAGVAASGRVFSGVFQYRCGAGAAQLREALDGGELGEIGLATAEVAWHRGSDYYGIPGRGTWAVDLGGVLMIQAIHGIDFLCWTLGRVESVTALSSSFARGLEVEDTVVAVMRFRSGAIGQVTATVGAQSNRSRLALYGTKAAAISCGETYSPTAEPFRLEVAGQAADEPTTPERAPGTQPGPVLHLAQVRDFVEAIETGREPLVTAASCRASLELIAAMQRSAATRTRVELPLAKDDPYYRRSPDQALG